ncbi:MAG: hypothetical protein ACRENO_00805 [Thermodesulfobacteriota bacterium]
MQKNGLNLPQIGSDLEIALSQIESGCIVSIIDNQNILIVKEEKVSFFNEINKLDISFEHIERPEFPTVAIRLKIKTIKGLNLRYEYFSLTESPDEINFLKLLKENGSLDLYFVSESGTVYRNEMIGPQELKNLNFILTKLKS